MPCTRHTMVGWAGWAHTHRAAPLGTCVLPLPKSSSDLTSAPGQTQTLTSSRCPVELATALTRPCPSPPAQTRWWSTEHCFHDQDGLLTSTRSQCQGY